MQGQITKRMADALKAKATDDYLWDEEVKGFGIKVTPKGRKVFLVQYRMGGRGFPVRRYTIGTYGIFTPEEARKRARSILQKVRDGIDPMAEKAEAKVNTVEKLVEQFVKSRRDKGRRSADAVETLLEREVSGVWGHRPTVSITRQDVVQLIDDIMARGTERTANRMLSLIKTMFTWAKRRGSIKSSPADGVEKPASDIARDRTPSDSELLEIWRGADQLGWPFGPAIKLMMLTGQRREEVGQLRLSELDLDKAIWTLPSERTKNGQPHDIHLPAMAVQILRDLPKFEGCDLAFTTNQETAVSGWSRAKSNLDRKILEARQKAAEEAGTDPAKVLGMAAWVLHDLRRSFATGLNNRGVLPHVADRILNHVAKSKGGVMAVYNRAAYAAEREAAMAVWGAHMEQLTTGETSKVLPFPKSKRRK